MNHAPDVLVIGGGPAGSTAAALLAQAGRQVVLLEQAEHPRFHIGESLLPRNLDVLERLGVLDQVRAIGVHKPGAEFVSDRSGRSGAFAFSQALNKARTYSFQVARADFDFLLFANAKARGAIALENTRVTEVTLGGDGVSVLAQGPDGATLEFRPRYVIDASGRDSFLAGRMRLKDSNKRQSTAAAYAHFRGVERRDGELKGYISIHLAEDGWFWLIPLPDGLMSVGFVGDQAAWKGRTGTPAELLAARIAASPTVASRLAGAEIATEVFSTGNYSYRARQGHGPGWMMVGDAYGFVDPMFSTGVLLAMNGGELGAAAADAWLDDAAQGDRMAGRAVRDLASAMDRISWLIHRINDPVMRSLFLAPRNTLWMRDGLINMLAGNLRGDWRAALPVLSFKLIYHLLSALHQRGMGPPMPEAIPGPTRTPTAVGLVPAVMTADSRKSGPRLRRP